MTSARSFGNYDLAGALADLIDNSIKARARHIELVCLFNDGNSEVRVVDDGYGMSQAELHAAMRPASQNPLEERSPDDLGRFGWGMKSASFSQCMKLTVISSKDGIVSGASWDLNDLKNWRMAVLSDSENLKYSSVDFREKNGTEVIWEDCDRLSENGSINETEFNALVTYSRDQLALIFHKYLAGEVRRKRLTMKLNGQPIEPYDPFYSKHDATLGGQPEYLRVNGKNVTIRAFILPHFSKLKAAETDRLAGEEGFLKNQGFYVYRNHRLIISGTWFRLAKFGELSQLVRISVDIPNSLDDIWKITLDKSDAQLPALLRNRLRQIVEGLKKQAFKVHRSKGGRISKGSTVSVWERYARGGEISYHINREHPLIAALLKNDDQSKEVASAALKMIEQGFPVEAFSSDSTERPDDIHQTEGNADKFRKFLEITLPIMLAEEGGNFKRFEERLRNTQPFSSHWKTVEEFLEYKGWVNAGT
jgi:hypothetical protein